MSIQISKHIGEGFGKGELYDVLVALRNGQLPISGETYFVSKKGNNVDGLSWETAFTTIEAAISASNTYTALTENTGRRNRIYIDGGPKWEETLTVFPAYCDMVGVGQTYGEQVRIVGTTAITTSVRGCHIYNITFYNIAASVPAVKISGSNSFGLEFHNCIFRNTGAGATIGLELGCSIFYLKVDHCKFIGNPAVLVGIQLDADFQFMFGEITNNFISAVTTGIVIEAGDTLDYQLLIKDNVICRSDPSQSTTQLVYGLDIQDIHGRSLAYIVHNWISAADAIHYANAGAMGNKAQWQCIDNHVVQAATADTETDEHV